MHAGCWGHRVVTSPGACHAAGPAGLFLPKNGQMNLCWSNTAFPESGLSNRVSPGQTNSDGGAGLGSTLQPPLANVYPVSCTLPCPLVGPSSGPTLLSSPHTMLLPLSVQPPHTRGAQCCEPAALPPLGHLLPAVLSFPPAHLPSDLASLLRTFTEDPQASASTPAAAFSLAPRRG